MSRLEELQERAAILEVELAGIRHLIKFEKDKKYVEFIKEKEDKVPTRLKNCINKTFEVYIKDRDYKSFSKELKKLAVKVGGKSILLGYLKNTPNSGNKMMAICTYLLEKENP